MYGCKKRMGNRETFGVNDPRNKAFATVASQGLPAIRGKKFKTPRAKF